MKFDVPSESNDDNDRELLANDVFIHYFAESELAKTKEDTDETQSASKRAAEVDENNDDTTNTSNEVEVAFDGLSCKAYKLDKLKMGKQAQRIAAFEESRDKI